MAVVQVLRPSSVPVARGGAALAVHGITELGRAQSGIASACLRPPQLLNSVHGEGRICASTLALVGNAGYGGLRLPSRIASRRRSSSGAGGTRCSLNEAPSSASGPPVYQGRFGPWSVEQSDVREVVLYRAGLVTAASAFVLGASSAFMPSDFPLKSILEGGYDALFAVGAGGLGLSLLLIHIYVTPIKRALQLLWAAGALGSVALSLKFASPADVGLVQFVLENPAGVWAVGPLFASLTGLAFKEGLCYGKFEAAALVFVIPSLLLGHLSGVMDLNTKLGFLAVWMALFTLFASRKFSQAIKDDIGDKSVFIFQALPEGEQLRIAQKLREQFGEDGDLN